MPDPRKKLYDALTNNNFELGTFDEFNSKMDNPDSRQKFYKAVSTNNFDLGSFDDFESKIGGKKKSQNPGSESTSSVQKSASVPKTGSLDGQASTKNSKGFPLIDTNSVAPGYGQQPEAESYASKLKRKEERIAKNKRVKELESSFYEATKNNTDDIEAENRLNDKLQTKGIWNNITATAKNAYNTVVQSLAATSPTMTGLYGATINTDPLAEEKSQVKKEAIKNKVNLTEQELNTKAQELFKSKEKENLFIDRANSFLDNIDEKDKNLLQQDRANKAMHLQEDNMKKYKVVKAMQSVASEKIRDLQKIKKQLQSNPELAQQYNYLVEEIKNIGGTIDKYQNDIQKNKNDLGSVNEELDLFKREYGDLNNFVGNVTATAKELGAGLQGSYLWLGNTIGALAGKSKNKDWTNAMQMAEGRVSDQVKSVADERETLRKPAQSIESAEGFINYTSDLVANQLPILAATSTGAGGLAALGMSSAGQKYTEMKGEVKEGKENYTAAQMAFAPLLYGAAEVVSEIPTLSILKKGGRVIESIAKNESQVLAKTAKQKAKEWAKDYGIDMAKEMSGEQFTNFTQNFNDKYILGKKEVNLLDNTGKVFKDTFTLTSILKTSPHVFGAIVKPFQSKNDLGALDENSRKIIEFSKQLNSENLTDTERSVIENQIQKATKESSEIVQNTIGKIDNMPSELYDEVVNLNSKAGEIKAQAQEINDGNLPNKKDLLKGLQEEYKALQDKRNSIIEGNTSVVDVLPLKEQEVLKKQAMEDLVTELNPDGKKNITITNEQVVERANQIYTESKNNEANKTQTSSPSSSEEAAPSVNSKLEVNLPLNNETDQQTNLKPEVNTPKELNFSEEEKTNVQKKVVEEPRVILRRGNLGSDAFFALPNEGIYGEVVDKIGADSNYSAYQYPEDFKIKDLSNDVVFDDYMSNKMYEQTKEDGYDAAYVMEIDGSKVLHIVNPGKLKLLDDKLPELRNNEGTSPTNTPDDGNIQSGAESDVAQGKDDEVQPSVKPRTNKGEVGQKLQEINKTTFGLDEKQSKANAVVMEKTIETMAERAGISKEEMFDQIDFEKGDATTIDKLTKKGKALFQIIGKNAKLSKEVKQFLSDAKSLEKKGANPKDIFIQTGWEKGTDGKWKYDMQEGKVEFKKTENGNLEDVLDYPELLTKYPEAKEISIVFNSNMDMEGMFDPTKNRIFINPSSGIDESRLTLLHEIQHWIQNKEGFSKGGNTEMARNVLQSKINEVKSKSEKNLLNRFKKLINSKQANPSEIKETLSSLEKIAQKEDFKLYESIAGEVEARNVETRFNIPMEQRTTMPLSETEDVSRDEQIVLFQGEQGAMLAEDGKYIIYALTDPNVSTPLHEMAHVYEHYLTDAEKQTVLDEAGHESWTRETSEFFARGFEKYLADGIAPNPEMKQLFESFKKWLTDIYNGITNSEIDIKLSPEMQKVFDAMLGEKTNFDKNKNTDGKKSAKKGIQSNNGTKKNGVEKNTDSSKKPKKEEYLKISQKGKTPLSERKFKGDRYKANAIQPTDEYSLVLNYFVSGGKISSDTILELFDSESEVKAKNNGFNGIASKKGVTLNALAHQLWEDNRKFSISKIKDNIIDVVSSHNTIQEVTDTILKNNDVEAQDNEIDRIEAENAFFEVAEEEKASEEEMQEAQSILDQLTESEIAELADNIEMSYADFVKDLENRMVTFDLGPFTNNKGIIQSDGNIVNDEGEFFSKESVSNVKYVNKQEPKTEAPSKKVTEQFLDWLDEMENNLDQFGKENLSSGIPIVVAKAAIQAMRVAVKSGMAIAEVIEAGLDAVKASEWYKNLSQKDKSQAEMDFMDSFGNPKIDEPSQRQTENLLNRSVSDKISEEDAYEEVKSTFEKSRTELINKKSFKEYAREAYRNYVKRFTDRQYLAKSLLNKSGMQSVKNRIINAHGASGRAKIQFEEAYNEIYKGLSTTERNTLDEIIQAKRFIAIDENREARGLEPVSHPNFIDKNISKKFLSKLEKELGSEKYNDLSKRAEAYFKTYKGLLKNMLDNGLISQASYDSMSDVDYQPRVFLQFVTDFNGDLETSKRTNNVDSGGLSADQIKSMSEGDANSLVLNSEWLLMNSLLSRSKAIAMNNINKRFMTGEFQAAQKRFDALDPKNLKGDDVRFYKYFKELSSKIIDNPVIGKKETGSPKFKYDKTPDNFGKAYYYIDGVRNEFFIEKELHESWNDNLEGIFSSNLKEFLPYISGAALVKAIATGNNPAFPIVNTPRDFMFTIAFSDQYSKIVPKAMFQVAKDVVNSIKEIRKSDSDILKKYIEYGGAMDFLSSQGTLKKESLIGQIIDKNVSANTRDIAKDIFSKVTLHKISQYSEMMFRLGIFQRSIKNQLEDLGFTDVSEVKDAQQLDDIYTNAVANARSILDFNQGGSVTKDLEAVIPYINVAFQGGRVAATAFENDPVGTSSRVMQVATMASIVPIGISLALISALKSDDDEEKSSYDIYLDALSGISRYQKMKYINIVTGVKDDEGQYQVIKIAKAQELSTVMSVTDDIYNNFIRKLADKEKKTASRIIDDAVFTFNSNVMPVDFTSPAGLVTRNPMAKATLTYLTGYDFFREEPLSADIGKVPKPVEGLNNPNVEDFYKKLGTEYGMSPVRSKAFVESLITGPNTNPFVGMLYGGADAAFSDKGMKEIGADLAKSVYKSTGKRLISYTSDFNRQLDANKDLQDKIDKINIKKYKMKAEFNQLAKDYMNKELSKEDLNKKIQELEPEDRLRMIKKIKDKIRMKDIDGNILDIKYEQEPEAKALLIMHYYGDVFDGSKESKEVLRQMKRAKGVLTPKVMFEYKKLKNQLEMKKTPN